jgi:hypothetical protein
VVNALTSPGGSFLYRWAGVQARSDSPSVYELVEAGWVPVAHDTRYGSTLCMLEKRPEQQIANTDGAVAIVFNSGEASA